MPRIQEYSHRRHTARPVFNRPFAKRGVDGAERRNFRLIRLVEASNPLWPEPNEECRGGTYTGAVGFSERQGYEVSA